MKRPRSYTTTTVPYSLVLLVLMGLGLGNETYAQATQNVCDRFALHQSAESLAPLGYRERTEQAIKVFTEVAEQLRKGNDGNVSYQLSQIAASLCELQITSEHYRKLAEEQNNQCEVRAEELHVRIAWLYQNEQTTKANLNQLSASLAQATSNLNSGSGKRAELLASLNKTQAELTLRKKRLEELRRWWWVPGYGQFLAIRELVEKDSARTDGLLMDLATLKILLSDKTVDMEKYRALRDSLDYKITTAQWSGKQLLEMRQQVRADLGESKGLFLFLADAEKFWEIGSSIELNSIETSLSRIEALQQKLDEGRVVRTLDNRKMTLADQLLLFATRATENSQFFLDSEDNYCSLTQKTTCPAGYSYDLGNQFCWTDCPTEYIEDSAPGTGISATCKKPRSYSTQFSPYREVLKISLKMFTPIIEQLDVILEQNTAIPAEQKAKLIAERDKVVASRDVFVMSGLVSCAAVNNGLCEANESRTRWAPVCREHFKIMPIRMTRQYPQPPEQPPSCFAICPENMVDLGEACGKTHVLPH